MGGANRRADMRERVLLAEDFYSVNDALQKEVASVLAGLELTEALADVLWQLDPAGPPLARRTLADRLHCDPSNLTFLVDRLEERGLAERVADPADRRVKAVQLTAAGARTRERLILAVANSTTFAELDEDEQRTLAALLGKCARDQLSPSPSA